MTEQTHTFYHLTQLVADWLRCHLSERQNVIYVAKRCIHLKKMFKGAFLGQNGGIFPVLSNSYKSKFKTYSQLKNNIIYLF